MFDDEALVCLRRDASKDLYRSQCYPNNKAPMQRHALMILTRKLVAARYDIYREAAFHPTNQAEPGAQLLPSLFSSTQGVPTCR